MKHKAIRVDNLMYKGCEPHWKCTICGDAVPFHCYTKEEFENMCCSCHANLDNLIVYCAYNDKEE